MTGRPWSLLSRWRQREEPTQCAVPERLSKNRQIGKTKKCTGKRSEQEKPPPALKNPPARCCTQRHHSYHRKMENPFITSQKKTNKMTEITSSRHDWCFIAFHGCSEDWITSSPGSNQLRVSVTYMVFPVSSWTDQDYPYRQLLMWPVGFYFYFRGPFLSFIYGPHCFKELLSLKEFPKSGF